MEDDFRNGANRRCLTFTKDRNIMQTRVYNYSFLSFDREIEENISTDPVARASENKIRSIFQLLFNLLSR